MPRPRWSVEIKGAPDLGMSEKVAEKMTELLGACNDLSDKGFRVVLATVTFGLGGSITITDEEALNEQDSQCS